jgi:hypothetical protein
MEYYNNILVIPGTKLIKSPVNPEGIISKSLYDKLSRESEEKDYNCIKIIRRGCYGQPALIDFESLPSKYKSAIIEKYGDPREQAKKQPFKDRIQPDPKALEFFTAFRLDDGRALPERKILEHCNDAAILNAIGDIYKAMQNKRASLGGSSKKGVFWTNALKAINDLRNDFPNTLPDSERRLKERFEKYQKSSYRGLMKGNWGNDNPRKVSLQIENLLLSLYTMPNKPYATSVHELYQKFVNGEITVYDQSTGEILNRENYMRDGKPIEISESTVWNYINLALNRATVDKKRTGSLEFTSTHRPHHHRHSPNFSFSKISLDDRDLPRKMHDHTRVKAYYAYDVASGAVIGKAYSRDKNRSLFIECMRDMFRLIEANNFPVPQEAEVEHHLVNNFADGLMKAGLIFPFVRWCNPGNSPEKRAEHFNRAKKYGKEKDLQAGIGRFYNKLEANRPKIEKVNDQIKERTYSFEQLVADDLEAIKAYNNEKHPKQKKYPGMTRWQVLCANINRKAGKMDKAVLYRFIGEVTKTTIRRNQYCTVQGAEYQIENLSMLNRLKSNNYEVEAYWLQDNENMINEVFLYQDDELIGKATKIVKYNEATCEQTDDDRKAYTEQAKYVGHFDKCIRDRKENLIKARIIPTEELTEIESVPVTTIEIKNDFERNTDDIEKLLNEYDPMEYKNGTSIGI